MEFPVLYRISHLSKSLLEEEEDKSQKDTDSTRVGEGGRGKKEQS